MAAAPASTTSPSVPPSKRIRLTDPPCIVTMQKMLRGKEGVLSLAQGIVHWAPPAPVAEALARAVAEPDVNAYGADDGLDALRAALQHKLASENGLHGVEVMITAGANQAYVNAVIALLDAGDRAVLFNPFYFNHRMALQMTGGGNNVVEGRATSDALPDADWLAEMLAADHQSPVRMVTVVNPSNPSGVIMPQELLQRISDICARHGVWLIVDNTYEYFTYEEEGCHPHTCVGGDHIVNIFSFSKGYGMMGWRVGYLAYPPRLRGELLKAQDTIAICPAVASQKAALAALDAGRPWVKERVRGLAANRRSVMQAVDAALGPGHVTGGSGAIYLMVRLPDGCGDDLRVIEWLTEKHRVCAIPGSACGAPGSIRLCYANLQGDAFEEAARRLRAGLAELAERGSAALA